MMKCEDVLERLPDDDPEVVAHVASCTSCRTAGEEYRQDADRFRGVLRKAAGEAGLAMKVEKLISKAPAGDTEPLQARSRFNAVPLAAAAMALVATTLVIWLFVVSNAPPESSVPTGQAASHQSVDPEFREKAEELFGRYGLSSKSSAPRPNSPFYKEAETLLRENSLSSDAFRFRRRLAGWYRKLGEPEKAINHTRELIRQNPKHQFVWHDLFSAMENDRDRYDVWCEAMDTIGADVFKGNALYVEEWILRLEHSLKVAPKESLLQGDAVKEALTPHEGWVSIIPIPSGPSVKDRALDQKFRIRYKGSRKRITFFVNLWEKGQVSLLGVGGKRARLSPEKAAEGGLLTGLHPDVEHYSDNKGHFVGILSVKITPSKVGDEVQYRWKLAFESISTEGSFPADPRFSDDTVTYVIPGSARGMNEADAYGRLTHLSFGEGETGSNWTSDEVLQVAPLAIVVGIRVEKK